MTIDKEKMKSDYLKVLNDTYNKIDTLTSSQRTNIIEKIKEYYKYLADNGLIYGKLALEVINDEGMYGKVANIYLETQSVFEGIPKEIIPEMKQKIMISLAKRDAEMRVEADRAPTDSSYPEIAEYHIDEMKKLKVPAVAWGGLVMEKLIGPGACGKLYEEKAGVMDSIIMILESKKISRDDTNMPYSSERLLQGIKHAVKVYHTGIYSDFQPTATAGSKEDAARQFNVDVSRIELIPEANQDMHESKMVPTNV